jgi:hypothetical protein
MRAGPHSDELDSFDECVGLDQCRVLMPQSGLKIALSGTSLSSAA